MVDRIVKDPVVVTDTNMQPSDTLHVVGNKD